MKQATGNLWDYDSEVVVITTNGVVNANGKCVMGRGCAQEARDMFPGIDRLLGTYITQHGNRPFRLGLWQSVLTGTHYRIASFPTKLDWRDPSRLDLIAQSAVFLKDMANKFGWTSIVMPRPGCGNGGLSWTEVHDAIQPILDDRFTVITHGEPELPVQHIDMTRYGRIEDITGKV